VELRVLGAVELRIEGRPVPPTPPQAAWQQALALFAECGSPEADQVRTLLRAEPQPSATGDAAGASDR